MALYSFWNNRAQRAAENLDDRGIMLNHIVYPSISTFFFRAVPVWLAIYYGQGAVTWLLENVPQVVTDIISVLGGVLPALGIALLMNIVIKEKIQLIFFFAGFVLLAFVGLDMISLVFMAALVAYIVYLSTGRSAAAETTANTQVSDDFVEDDDLF